MKKAYLIRFEGSGFELDVVSKTEKEKAPISGLFSSALVLGRDRNDAIEIARKKIINIWSDRGYDKEIRGKLILKPVEVIPTSYFRWVFFSQRVKGFTFFPAA